MKFYQFVLLCLILLTRYAGNAFSKGKYLIPFRQGTTWGVSDEQGTLVIPCKYKDVDPLGQFIFAMDNSAKHPVKIFSNAGKLLDSCFYYLATTNNRYLVLNYSRAPFKGGYFMSNDEVANPYVDQAFPGALHWKILKESVTAYILLPDKTKKIIPGNVCAMTKDVSVLPVVQNGKCGIYDFSDDSFVVSLGYTSITYLKPMSFIAKNNSGTTLFDIDGTRSPFHPDPNAIYIDGSTGNYIMKVNVKPAAGKTVGYSLISNDGKELISADRDWSYEPKSGYKPQYIRLRKPKDQIRHRFSVFQVADLNGNIIVPSAQEITALANNLYAIYDIDSGDSKQIIYSASLNKELFSAPKKDDIIIEGLPSILKDGYRYFYDDQNNVLAAIPDSTIKKEGLNKLVQRVEITPDARTYRATGVLRNTYYAFRKDSTEHYVIYDKSFHKMDSSYDDLANRKYPENCLSFKKNGKWGLVDYAFKEIVPARYDKPLLLTPAYAAALLNGRRYRIYLNSMETVDMDKFDEFGPSSYGNKFLAVTYAPQPARGGYGEPRKVKTLYVTDRNGNVIDSAVRNDPESYKYVFNSAGKLLKYTNVEYQSISDIYLLENIHDQGKKCPYTQAGIEFSTGYSFTYALLIECRNDKGNAGFISANDFSTVIPLGKYDNVFAHPVSIPSADSMQQPLEVVILEGNTKKMHDDATDPKTRMNAAMQGKPMPDDREIIGYYSLSGVKFWRD